MEGGGEEEVEKGGKKGQEGRGEVGNEKMTGKRGIRRRKEIKGRTRERGDIERRKDEGGREGERRG